MLSVKDLNLFYVDGILSHVFLIIYYILKITSIVNGL